MKTIVNVNRHNVAHNEKHEDKKPVLSVKTYLDTGYGDTVVIYGQDGKEAARLVYRPDKPLSCGARVWLETENIVHIYGQDGY